MTWLPASTRVHSFLPMADKSSSRIPASQTDVEGTGLGLALSKELMEVVGGIVDVTSEVGKTPIRICGSHHGGLILYWRAHYWPTLSCEIE